MAPLSPPSELRARLDPTLSAQVIARAPLAYTSSASLDEDRPPFIRAASGICFLGDDLVIVQDDASFIAVREPTGATLSVALPAGPGGRRRFEKRLGNKLDKLDLEAAFAFAGRVFAIGSGSLPAREKIVVLDLLGEPFAKVFDAAALFAKLHTAAGFSGGSLNIEGATAIDGALRLFQRGNGLGEDLRPAVAEVDLAALVSWIDGQRAAAPDVQRVIRFDLGDVDGVAFGFTDACARGDRVLFLAAAERSPNTVDDGAIIGSRVGVIAGDDVRVTPLCDERGQPAALKAEGIALDPHDRSRAWLVLDCDDPEVPSELCEVRLDGPWWG